MDLASIRDQLDHPILDGDGHTVEYGPLLRDFIVEEAGPTAAKRLDAFLYPNVKPEQRRERRVAKAWWGLPAANTLDRATAMLPELMFQRLDEFGIDFAVVYPTYGLFTSSIQDDELRLAYARACNRYCSEVMLDHRDRLEPVATIPMNTPDEALAELDFAVAQRGLKAIVMAGVIVRALPGADDVPGARWIDTVAHDSIYDYDAVWARCVDLGVAPTFHTVGSGWGSRTSTTNYVFNHVGHFAAAQEAACRAIVMGGVAKRFPELRFSFLEGGVAWAASLCSDLVAHFEKRNVEAVKMYDPARIDRRLLQNLIAQYGVRAVVQRSEALEYELGRGNDVAADEQDEFATAGIDGPEDIVELFTERFFFGCEADDPMTALAFDRGLPPVGHDLRPIFASDIGHFDVRDMRNVLTEAWELVEHGRLDSTQFRKFTFSNAAELWTAQNPGFFEDTQIAHEVRLLQQDADRTVIR